MQGYCPHGLTFFLLYFVKFSNAEFSFLCFLVISLSLSASELRLEASGADDLDKLLISTLFEVDPCIILRTNAIEPVFFFSGYSEVSIISVYCFLFVRLYSARAEIPPSFYL